MAVEGRRIEIRGTVQGVGFRPWVYRLACEEGLSGLVRNDAHGVVIEAFGPVAALGAFLRRVETEAPPAAQVRELQAEPIPVRAGEGFEIVPSLGHGDRRVSIPADLATCPECLRETLDPADRRHGYAFTNCTNCGPRYTIAVDVPYDRPKTTMAGFALCPECRREYEDPRDRRFHAQPIACPACGPRLRLLAADGSVLLADGPTQADGLSCAARDAPDSGAVAPSTAAPGEPPASPRGGGIGPALAAAARALCDGRIVAVKGLGGYHLACDATSSQAVRELRSRKHRDQKAFAVMVDGLDAARALARIDTEEAVLLASIERPIVLVERRPDAALAAEVAPGNPLVGLMLAYTPLHHLLLREAGRPLVMTSGNLSDEPMAAADEDAAARLGGIADLFLAHDRPIENRCDDSVARVVAGVPTLLRRSRGYVPRPVALARPVERPILACGAHLKNTFCLAAGDSAWLGPHIGDLDNLEASRAFEEQVDHLQRFLGIGPELVVHDLHPDYVSTRYALQRPEPKLAVQHHHAHVASALAEHGLDGPVLGLAWDGTGYGTDGTAWGGELLRVDGARYERLATLRPLRLVGGDEAIRQVWRIALAALDDAFDGTPPLAQLALFANVPQRDVAVVRQLAAKGLRAPLAHGAGRWFDAIGALGLARPRSSYEGQVALEWNLVAQGDAPAYPFELVAGTGGLEVDLRPMVRGVVEDLLRGRAAGRVSARFHATLAEAAARLVAEAAPADAALPVVLTGGCFQNPRLVEGVLARLAGRRVVRHGLVPPGDGGLALGQVLVADALMRAGAR